MNFREESWLIGNDRCEEGSNLFPLPPQDVYPDNPLSHSSSALLPSGLLQFTDGTAQGSAPCTPANRICECGSSVPFKVFSPACTPNKSSSAVQKALKSTCDRKSKNTKSNSNNTSSCLDRTGEGITASSISRSHRCLKSVKTCVNQKLRKLKYQHEFIQRIGHNDSSERPRKHNFEDSYDVFASPIQWRQRKTVSSKLFASSVSPLAVTSGNSSPSQLADGFQNLSLLHLPVSLSYSADHEGTSPTVSESLSVSSFVEGTNSRFFSPLPAILSEYTEIKELGRGAFGKVRLYSEESTGTLVAIKLMSLTDIQARRRYQKEKKVLSLVRNHPHTVKLLGSWEDSLCLYLKMEFCPGGSVASLAEEKRKNNELWEELELLRFLAQMSMALEALHRVNIAHVDVKPENILIDSCGDYCLSDFGCSVCLDGEGNPQAGFGFHRDHRRGPSADSLGSCEKSLPNTDISDLPSGVEESNQSANIFDEGDYRYMCSDMLNQKLFIKEGDLFALGMSMFELMCGETPPGAADELVAFRQWVPHHRLRARGYSEQLISVVVSLLDSDPLRRPSARCLLQKMYPPKYLLEQVLRDELSLASFTSKKTDNDHRQYVDVNCNSVKIPQESGLGCLLDISRSSPTELRYLCASMKCISYLLQTALVDYSKNQN